MPLVGYSGLQWHAAADEASDTARYGLKGNRNQIHCADSNSLCTGPPCDHT